MRKSVVIGVIVTCLLLGAGTVAIIVGMRVLAGPEDLGPGVTVAPGVPVGDAIPPGPLTTGVPAVPTPLSGDRNE